MNRLTKGSAKTTWAGVIGALLMGGGLLGDGLLDGGETPAVVQTEDGQAVVEVAAGTVEIDVPPLIMSDGGTITVRRTGPAEFMGTGMGLKELLILLGLGSFAVGAVFQRDDDVNSAKSGAEPTG